MVQILMLLQMIGHCRQKICSRISREQCLILILLTVESTSFFHRICSATAMATCKRCSIHFRDHKNLAKESWLAQYMWWYHFFYLYVSQWTWWIQRHGMLSCHCSQKGLEHLFLQVQLHHWLVSLSFGLIKERRRWSWFREARASSCSLPGGAVFL